MTGKLKYFLLLLVFAQNSFAQQDTILAGDSVVDEYELYKEEDSQSESTSASDRHFLQKTGLPDSVPMRRIPDSLLKRYQASDDFWYANTEPEKPKPEKTNYTTPLFQRSWFQTLLWITIVGGFAGFLIWYLAGMNVGLFRSKRRTMEENLAEGELTTEDLFAIDYRREIDRAVSQGDHRLATRLMFLRLLKELSERNIIEYKQGKTNFDYLMQLQPTRYYPDFFRITRNYEYSWYGHFEVTPEKFALIKKDFEQFENRYHR